MGSGMVWAQESVLRQWSASKTITIVGNHPYKRIFLDEEVYANAKKDLSDLRIVDAHHQMVPYYIIHNQDSSAFQRSDDLPYVVKNTDADTVITIDNKNHLKINSIQVDMVGDFKRSYALYVNNDQAKSILKKTGSLYRLSLPSAPKEDTKITFPTPIYEKEIIIKISNKDDLPLDIRRIKATYQVDKMVFKEEAGRTPYTLYFGNSEASKPSYDISLFWKDIEKEQQDDCMLGTMNQQQSSKYEVNNSWARYGFHSVIVAVSFLIIFICIKKLKA